MFEVLSGSDFFITATIKAPNKTVIYENKAEEDFVVFENEAIGEYEVCFKNEASLDKFIGFNIVVEDEKHEKESKSIDDIENIKYVLAGHKFGKDDAIYKEISKLLRLIEDKVELGERMCDYLTLTLTRGKFQVDLLSSYISRWNLLKAVSLLFTVAWEIYTLKQFFEVRIKI